MSFLLPTTPLAQRAVVAGGSAGHGSFTLNFHVQHQQQTEWCWAAVSASVADHFGSTTWTQCKVASAELNLSCCNDPLPGGCNRAWSLDTALQSVGHFVNMLNGSMPFAALKQRISAGAPVGIRIVWADGSGAHFIATAGWVVTPGGTEFVDVTDPWYGDAQFKYTDVVSAYRATGDLWSHTYLTGRIGAVVGGSGASSPISA